MVTKMFRACVKKCFDLRLQNDQRPILRISSNTFTSGNVKVCRPNNTSDGCDCLHLAGFLENATNRAQEVHVQC